MRSQPPAQVAPAGVRVCADGKMPARARVQYVVCVCVCVRAHVDDLLRRAYTISNMLYGNRHVVLCVLFVRRWALRYNSCRTQERHSGVGRTSAPATTVTQKNPQF